MPRFVARTIALPSTLVAFSLLALSTNAFAAPPEKPADAKKKPAANAPAPTPVPAATPAPAGPVAPSADGTPIAVLTFDEDGFEEQAEAFTLAVRGRLRLVGGWAMRDDVPSLALLAASNRCGAELDAACQTKIADQLKLDYFVWGRIDRATSQKGYVTATMRIYRRNGAMTETKETYSENLKDSNDDALRQIAQRALDKLLGRSAGKLLITAPPGPGQVVVDSKLRFPIENGRATIEVPAGPHRVEVFVKGYATQSKNLTVPASDQVTFDAPVVKDEHATGEADNGIPGRTLASVGLFVAGGAALVGSGYFTARFISENSKAQDGRTLIQGNDDICNPQYSLKPTLPNADALVQACTHAGNANRAWPWAWVLGGVGVASVGVGVYLLVTAPSKEPEKKTGMKSLQFTPLLSDQPGLSLSGRF